MTRTRSPERWRGSERRRGQANLLAVAVALIVVTAVTVVAVALADGALADATRDPEERRAAERLGDRLVAGESGTALRANVVNETAVRELSAADLDRLAPVVAGRSVRVRLDGGTVVERGDPAGGVTVRRVVRAGERVERSSVHDLGENRTVQLPERTPRARLSFGVGSTVRTVRADGRIVLHDPGGLTGTYDVRVSRFDDVTLSFDAVGDVEGSVTVSRYPVNATATTLEVTVGERA